MKLFLGGGGGGEDSIELDKKFIASLDLSKPILYIPIAMDTEKYPYSECAAWLSGALNLLGVRNIVMWIEEDLKQKTEKDFDQFAGVYIGGGNTFKLLKELKEFGTFEILRKLAEKNIPIYGGSAGAIILARTILPAIPFDENKINLKDFTALNLVGDYDVWCHYKPSIEDEDIKVFAKEHDLKKIIAIPEDAGLFVDGKTIEVVGLSNVKIFSGESTRILESGKIF